MTDWSKIKVADLREACKAREIPLTGLKLKQQYVDKLEEHEAQNAERANEDAEDAEVEMNDDQPAAQVNGDDAEPHEADPSDREPEKGGTPVDDAEADKPEAQENTPQASIPPAFQTEESRTAEGASPQETAPAEVASVQEALFVPEPENIVEKIEEKMQEQPHERDDPAQQEQHDDDASTTVNQAASSPKVAISPTPQPTQLSSDTSTPRTSQIPSSELAEDQRRRRKRSATPIPSSEEISRKRVRLSEEANEAKAEEALQQMKAATVVAKEIRMEITPGEPATLPVAETEDAATTEPSAVPQKPTQEMSETQDGTPQRALTRSRSPSEERDIPPAIHPATSSLYISRLKRPVQPQALRSHIISKANSRSSGDSDLITAFYIDTIKTHAFVSFTSVSAASRVRSAMHGVRFPDEASREPLFVDYVPTDKVQPWIDQETETGFGQGGRNRVVFEVVYDDNGDGVEAIFQVAGATNPRPPLEPSRSSRMSFDRQQPAMIPTGVHPDRATLVPREGDRDRDWPRAPPTGPRKASVDTGRGFKALDELFSSTTAKPKLYYKPVQSSVANERLDLFRGLRVGHNEMGRSGDEGMKRYSFEKSKDYEEWVDKGPEFGHGRRGQERLAGGERGFRGRGRGGGYRGRPMDSWRGGAGR